MRVRPTVIQASYTQYPSTESAARKAGAMRSEGKEYIVQDGDMMPFRFNV